MQYVPTNFLRCHSRTDKDSADVSTQVWQAVFDPIKTSRLVATCGGNKLCVINVETGIVEYRYSCPKGLLYTLSWSTIDQTKKKILATAGTNNSIVFIDLSTKTAYYHFSLSGSSKLFISAVLFHPEEKKLFCSLNDGHVYVFEFNIDKGRVVDLKQLSIVDLKCEIFGLAFCQNCDCLLIASGVGLMGWNNSQKQDQQLMSFELPENPNELYRNQNENVIDSIEIIKDSWIATKVALHGVIYVFNLDQALSKINDNKCVVHPSYILKWSDTDNYFMSCGIGLDGKLLACGDDKGSIWIYNLKDLDLRKSNINNEKVIEVENILKWPKLHDSFLKKKKKLEVDVYDIVIAKCAVHSSGQYIIAVTNNNFVCLYSSL